MVGWFSPVERAFSHCLELSKLVQICLSFVQFQTSLDKFRPFLTSSFLRCKWVNNHSTALHPPILNLSEMGQCLFKLVYILLIREVDFNLVIYWEFYFILLFVFIPNIVPLEEVKLQSLEDEGQYRNGWLICTRGKSFAVYAATAGEKQAQYIYIRTVSSLGLWSWSVDSFIYLPLYLVWPYDLFWFCTLPTKFCVRAM